MRRAANATVIDHDNIIRPNEEAVRGIRDEIDRLTAELTSTITVNNDILRGAVAEATRGAMATDNGEGHG
jgi:vacuolar-type H+-ATPase subunit E/Vma4